MKYKHGGDVYGFARQAGRPLTRIYDFSANINPLGTSALAKAAIVRNLELLQHYPDPRCYELREGLAKYLGLTMEQILLGNGASELIYLAVRALYIERALVTAPTFSEYGDAVVAAGGLIKEISLSEDSEFALPVASIRKALDDIDAVFLCNPNNPTGRVELKENLSLIIEAAHKANILVIVDEAFMDFVQHRDRFSVLDMVNQYPNLLVLYSMTKFFGMPGLRLGAILGNPDLLDRIAAVKDPWSVNALAQIAGMASLGDIDYMAQTREMVQRERAALIRALNQISGLKIFPGDANYLLVKIENQCMTAAQLAGATASKGVLIRDCANFQGLSIYFFRVAVRTKAENEVLVQVLAEVMKGA